MNVLIVLQARMGSTRLPGKVMLPLLGKPAIERQIERLLRVRGADGVVVATSGLERDRTIVGLCEKIGIDCVVGSEADVLSRFVTVIDKYAPAVVVRSTADCPLTDPRVIDSHLQFFFDTDADYVSQVFDRTLPRGMGSEVIRSSAMLQADKLAVTPQHREHATSFIIDHPELFRLATYKHCIDLSQYRLTLDTEDDFALIRQIYETLYPGNPTFGLEEIISLLQSHPDMVRINQHVKQKHRQA